jgi:transposase
MKPPLYSRHVTDEERTALEAGLRSSDAFTVRRGQILLASAERQTPSSIAKTLRCASQTVRHVLHAFDARGLACAQRGSNVPITVKPVLHAEKREQVRAILHQSPRTFGQPASVWTLKRLAAVCHEQGLSAPPLMPDHAGCHRPLGRQWATRQTLDCQSRPGLRAKKNAAIA